MARHAIRFVTLLGVATLASAQFDEQILLQLSKNTQFKSTDVGDGMLRLKDRETIKLVTIEDSTENSSAVSCPRGCGNWAEWVNAKQTAPACCLEQSKQVFYSIADALEKEHVAYSLSGGSLVGALRGGDMISWDYDVDLEIYASPEQGSRILHKWVRDEKQPGGLLARFHVSVGGLSWVNNGWGDFNDRDKLSGGDVHLDIGFSTPDPDHPPDVRPCSFGSRVVQCRADAATLLDHKYKGDWMQPHRWCHWPTELCPETDELELRKCNALRQHLRSHTCSAHPQLLIGRGGC